MPLLSVRDVANLKGCTTRAIEIAIKRGEFCNTKEIVGRGRGGKQLRIPLESLSQDLQDKYYGIQKERKEEELTQFSNNQLHAANDKKGCVLEYRRSGLSPEEFVRQRNSDGYYAPITVGQLYAWQRIMKNGGDIAELVDKRGGRHRRGTTTIPEDAWQLFYSIYMTQQQRTVAWCYKLTKMEYPDIPSVKAFQRKIKTIPPYAIKFYREGETAYRDALPSMIRSRRDIQSNDIWFSDHHQFDVFVRNSKGRICRPWLTTFFDARSNVVTGFLIREAYPDATAIKQSFRMAVERYGIPNEVYFDNGKDYKSSAFNKDYPDSLVRMLGVGTIYATKYHGQAKTVERFHGTLESQFGRSWDTYTGKDAKRRPECMRIPNEKIAEIAPDMDTFIQAFNNWLDLYHTTPSRGRDMDGKPPIQVYNDNLAVRRIINDNAALRLLCGEREERTVNKNGISLMNNFYYSDELLQYVGQKVSVMYDPENIDVVAVFDADNEAVCWAPAKLVTPYRHTTKVDYREAAKQRKAARKQIIELQPTAARSTHEIIAQNQMLELFGDVPDVPERVTVTPQTSRNIAKLAAEQSELNQPESSISDIFIKAIGG